jgi:hypothetical protein
MLVGTKSYTVGARSVGGGSKEKKKEKSTITCLETVINGQFKTDRNRGPDSRCPDWAFGTKP